VTVVAALMMPFRRDVSEPSGESLLARFPLKGDGAHFAPPVGDAHSPAVIIRWVGMGYVPTR
jgi:hypothetical protein